MRARLVQKRPAHGRRSLGEMLGQVLKGAQRRMLPLSGLAPLTKVRNNDRNLGKINLASTRARNRRLFANSSIQWTHRVFLFRNCFSFRFINLLIKRRERYSGCIYICRSSSNSRSTFIYFRNTCYPRILLRTLFHLRSSNIFNFTPSNFNFTSSPPIPSTRSRTKFNYRHLRGTTFPGTKGRVGNCIGHASFVALTERRLSSEKSWAGNASVSRFSVDVWHIPETEAKLARFEREKGKRARIKREGKHVNWRSS